MVLDNLTDLVLYRDRLMIIINKPGDIAVERRGRMPEGKVYLEDYFGKLKYGFSSPPIAAHRLDHDTTGCLILGRNAKGLRRLGKLFEARKIEKTYWAVCRGCPEKLSGTIDRPLMKWYDQSGWGMKVAREVVGEFTGDEAGSRIQKAQHAVTTYRTLRKNADFCLIECKPKTGRTHQLRVHLSSIGVPILGDPVYGDPSDRERGGPMMLHARRVHVPLYADKDKIVAEAEPPTYMAKLIESLS